jgi:FkbM family methyltransferase
MVLGQDLIVYDCEGSDAADIVAGEVNRGVYNLGVINFYPGDVVVDLGGHIGIVAMALAKKYGVRVYTFEAMPENGRALEKNVEVNKLENLVNVYQAAVTSDGRPIRMIGNLDDNSGGSTACLRDMWLPGHTYHDAVESIEVRNIFTHILPEERIRLLKIDVEGSEHEIIKAMLPEDFHRIDYMRGELHINSHLESQGWSIRQTYSDAKRYMNEENINLQAIRMAE